MASGYYTILGSLPHLPHFEMAERLPLTRLRLEQRISMLEAEEAKQLYLAEDLISQRKAVASQRTYADMAKRFRKGMAEITQPVLRSYVEDRIDQMTVLAALRLRREGRDLSKGGVNWGLGRRVRYIESHWNDPDFRLTSNYPWLPEARNLLEADDARGLDRFLLNINWQALGWIADREPLGFGGVVAFLFKWDILNAWLVRNAERATQKFKELMGEVKHGQ